ncbi:hypothetical protein OAG1_06250 [Agarivorans sp. OAG1]|uniref:Secreted protein n=1 Tax=Agarivorans albus MKT 106 TaxID=1331007 RepID=R9PRE8_AGAAL|nr:MULTISPECIES: hypothetical protein [Agarivorans]MPW30491.1 hypothetical protein [Agarivorans sp. B2Z047]UQN42288.1 hypothetical protein LQZ07_21335 [Agarivorans sp. B2Z047]BEU01825.1 hypothetical protein OAG1_06250 [Agarivorans sp. OAG1]GAD03833.1 hypothetical protein AALB_3913 [Agarivorans albus MKT 106]
MKAVMSAMLSVVFGSFLMFSAASQAAVGPLNGAQGSTNIGTSGIDRHTCQREALRGEVQSPFC